MNSEIADALKNAITALRSDPTSTRQPSTSARTLKDPVTRGTMTRPIVTTTPCAAATIALVVTNQHNRQILTSPQYFAVKSQLMRRAALGDTGSNSSTGNDK